MLSPQEKETMDAVFAEDGFDGIVKFLMSREELTIEVATKRAEELEYSKPDVPTTATPPTKEGSVNDGDKPEDSKEENLENAGDSNSVDGSAETAKDADSEGDKE